MPFKIGCDPEFVLADKLGNTFEASGIVRGNIKFGVDGSGQQCELRPDPSLDPKEVVINLRALMVAQLKKQRQLAAYEWIAGPSVGTIPTGGHIHFGLPEAGSSLSPAQVASRCDPLLAAPMAACESYWELRDRHTGGYGRFGDVRSNNGITVEYRTLGSWLSSPKITEAVLCIAKAVVHDLQSGCGMVPTPLPPAEWLQHAEIDKLKAWVKSTVFRVWERLELYDGYRAQFEFVQGIIESDKSIYSTVHGDMKTEWGLAAKSARTMKIDSSLLLGDYYV